MNEPMHTNHHCHNERLNTIISIGLLLVLLMCIGAYVYVQATHKTSDGQLIQLAGTIVGVFGGFMARGLTQQGARVDAGPAGTVNVNTNEPPIVDDQEPGNTP